MYVGAQFFGTVLRLLRYFTGDHDPLCCRCGEVSAPDIGVITLLRSESARGGHSRQAQDRTAPLDKPRLATITPSLQTHDLYPQRRNLLSRYGNHASAPVLCALDAPTCLALTRLGVARLPDLPIVDHSILVRVSLAGGSPILSMYYDWLGPSSNSQCEILFPRYATVVSSNVLPRPPRNRLHWHPQNREHCDSSQQLMSQLCPPAQANRLLAWR